MRKCLYVVVRADLDPGLQLAQVVHAAIDFVKNNPQDDIGDTVVILNAPDEKAVAQKWVDCIGVAQAWVFREPDLNNQVTAFATTGAAQEVLADLRPALKGIGRGLHRLENPRGPQPNVP